MEPASQLIKYKLYLLSTDIRYQLIAGEKSLKHGICAEVSVVLNTIQLIKCNLYLLSTDGKSVSVQISLRSEMSVIWHIERQSTDTSSV